MTSNPIMGLAIIVMASVGLMVSSVEQALSDSITTDEDIVGGGISLQALKELVCELAPLHGLSPPLCVLGQGERFIFATSTISTAGGNLVQWANNLLSPVTFTDGLDAGDAICQKHADDSGLPGTYKAWLSTTSVDAKNRIGDHTWIRRDGEVVASDKAQLLSCIYQSGPCLSSYILSEYNNTVPLGWWTGTYEDGTHNLNGQAGHAHCEDWTVGTAEESGWFGLTQQDNYAWTRFSMVGCDGAFGLTGGLLCLQN